MSTVEPTPESASRLGARNKADDLSNLNLLAGVVAVLLVVPGLFAGAGGLVGVLFVLASLAPPIIIAIMADREGGPRSARIAFIATGVFLLMTVLRLRG